MAPAIRLFVPSKLAEGETVPASEAQAHYLMNVMRRNEGDCVALFNGRDGEWNARISRSGRKSLAFEPIGLRRPQAAEPDCWLCFALLKRQKTDLVVEKATELGASLIQPIITERTQGDHVNLERLRAIATEAAEQCERLLVPELREPVKLTCLLTNWPRARRLFIADERRLGALPRPPESVADPIALMTGPEGGFTEQELGGIAAYPDVRLERVSLGARILRAETATIVGLGLLLAPLPVQE